MRRMIETVEAYPGLVPQALNAGNVTGRYFKADLGQRLRAVLSGGAMATTTTTKLELLQATSPAGAGAKAITGASVTITSEAAVNEASVDLTAAAATDTVTVNGVTFTMAAATSVPDREFLDAAGLVLCVNSAAYGVPGVKAVAAGAVVTLYHDPDDQAHIGPITLTVGAVAGVPVPATDKAQNAIDLDVSQLDLAGGFYYVACKVTTTANTVVAVLVDFYDNRFQVAGLYGGQATV